MTSDGFSGNQRYLIAPVALLIVLGGAGAGWGLERIIDLAGRAVPALARKHQARALVVVVAALIGLGFAFPSFQNFAPTMRSLQYQAELTDELPGLVREAGGARAAEGLRQAVHRAVPRARRGLEPAPAHPGRRAGADPAGRRLPRQDDGPQPARAVAARHRATSGRSRPG